MTDIQTGHPFGQLEIDEWRVAEWEIAEQLMNHPVEPIPTMAFIGAFYGEGPKRLETLFTSMRPWCGSLIVALQDPTDDEFEMALDLCNRVLVHPKYGHCEPSFNALYEAAREASCDWTWNLDGDELADLSLMASLRHAISNPDIAAAGAADILKRNTFALSDGRIIPGLTEVNQRLNRSSFTREPVPHAHPKGAKSRPPLWSQYGAIRQHRTVNEFLQDQVRYYDTGDPTALWVTSQLLANFWRMLSTTIGAIGAANEFYEADVGARAYGIAMDHTRAEGTWE